MQLAHYLKFLTVIGFCLLSELASAIPVLVPRDSVELVITPEDIRSAANYAMRRIPEVKDGLKNSLKSKFLNNVKAEEVSKPRRKSPGFNKNNQPNLIMTHEEAAGDEDGAIEEADDQSNTQSDDEFVGYYKPKDLKTHTKDLGVKYSESAYDSFYDDSD